MINDLAEKLMAATQRPGRPHSVEEFKGILRVALGAPTADETTTYLLNALKLTSSQLMAEIDAENEKKLEAMYRAPINAGPDSGRTLFQNVIKDGDKVKISGLSGGAESLNGDYTVAFGDGYENS